MRAYGGFGAPAARVAVTVGAGAETVAAGGWGVAVTTRSVAVAAAVDVGGWAVRVGLGAAVGAAVAGTAVGATVAGTSGRGGRASLNRRHGGRRGRRIRRTPANHYSQQRATQDDRWDSQSAHNYFTFTHTALVATTVTHAAEEQS